MCQPCCDSTYVKYLDADNVIDKSYLATLGTDVAVTHRPDHTHPFTEYLLSKGDQPPITTSIEIDGVVKPFCMCMCHRKDLTVCH